MSVMETDMWKKYVENVGLMLYHNSIYVIQANWENGVWVYIKLNIYMFVSFAQLL